MKTIKQFFAKDTLFLIALFSVAAATLYMGAAMAIPGASHQHNAVTEPTSHHQDHKHTH